MNRKWNGFFIFIFLCVFSLLLVWKIKTNCRCKKNGNVLVWVEQKYNKIWIEIGFLCVFVHQIIENVACAFASIVVCDCTNFFFFTFRFRCQSVCLCQKCFIFVNDFCCFFSSKNLVFKWFSNSFFFFRLHVFLCFFPFVIVLDDGYYDKKKIFCSVIQNIGSQYTFTLNNCQHLF